MSRDLGRRDFLTRGWKVGAVLAVAAGIWTSWDVLRIPKLPGAGRLRTLPVTEVPSDGAVSVSEARAYLTNVGGEVVGLSWKCPHLGCRVEWCDSSGQFECPCHGSDFNRLGEVRSGPAPRGMDRFATSVGVDGVVVIDTEAKTKGDPPGAETIDEPLRGPSCQD